MWAFIKKTLAPLWVGKWTGPTRLSVLNLRDGFRWLMDFAKLLCFPHILGSRFRKIILLVKTGSRIKSKSFQQLSLDIHNNLGSNFLYLYAFNSIWYSTTALLSNFDKIYLFSCKTAQGNRIKDFPKKILCMHDKNINYYPHIL